MCYYEPYVFHDMIYYTIVTVTTTGYGDISPQSLVGQIIYILFWVSFTLIIATRSTELFKMMKLKDFHDLFTKHAAKQPFQPNKATETEFKRSNYYRRDSMEKYFRSNLMEDIHVNGATID